jgi:hypothetical protein
MERLRIPVCRVLAALMALGCSAPEPIDGGDDDPGGGTSVPGTVRVEGVVRDLETGQPVSGSASVTVDGLSPPPAIAVSGASFVIDDVPAHSLFHILASAPPTYRSTYGTAVEVSEQDLTDVDAQVVSETFLQILALVFGEPGSGGILIVRAVDASGAPFAGLPAAAIAVPEGARGPYFLDERRQPDPSLDETSASGYIVFFAVTPGVVSLVAREGVDFTLSMPDSPVAPAAVTLADLLVTAEGAPPLPVDVSFSRDVTPIFELRGCVVCHDGSGIGKDLGDLHLNGEEQKMYRELVEEISPTHGTARVDVAHPEASLMLTMPSREEPPDPHPTVVFTGPTDPDYQVILGWITEGALDN